jgi:hypothetical protein
MLSLRSKNLKAGRGSATIGSPAVAKLSPIVERS